MNAVLANLSSSVAALLAVSFFTMRKIRITTINNKNKNWLTEWEEQCFSHFFFFATLTRHAT
jgi:hypothetical protein|tara:strand:+ start:512 stop:697 length:186 start_codon:yes stop_codon:yes gene_type:complete